MMVIIQKEIVDSRTRDTRGIFALDLTKAFATVSHFTLDISETVLGRSIHAYTSFYLSEGRAPIKIGQIKFEWYTIGAKGTSQGAVVSPVIQVGHERTVGTNSRGAQHLAGALRGRHHCVCTGGSDAEVGASASKSVRHHGEIDT